MSGRVAPMGAVAYKKGSFHLVPRKYTAEKKIVSRGYADRTSTELSHRSYKPQKHYFEVPPTPHYERDHERQHYNFYNLETKLIWRAFDTPELIGMLLHDETIRGHKHLYDTEFLSAASHWTSESRYWRCIGISKPFFSTSVLRAHCWEDDGTQVGTLRLSEAMRHALMDLERAYRRKEQGLDPNYLWDKWGPSGFIDGRRSDFLPRFRHNMYVDPDGVEITELDIAPFNTHEQIRERYSEFITADKGPYEGVFMSLGHGDLTLEDLGNEEVKSLYRKLNPAADLALSSGSAKLTSRSAAVSPDDLRTLLVLVANPTFVNQLGDVSSWSDVKDTLRATREEVDAKIDFARLLHNTRDEVTRVRRFFEEKCGFLDFMNTPDKTITGAVLAYVDSLQRATEAHEWAKPLALALSDLEKHKVMGAVAFRTFRLTEDLILDKRRRTWATRFAGEANEEATLDFLLENFGKRPERVRGAGTFGGEFDREQEPIGRNVQRRVLEADKQSTLALARKSKGRIFQRRSNPLADLHAKQVQNTAYLVR